MWLKKLVIQGFKSFKNREEIDFPDLPGLYFLTGDNRVEPELGANAAGKSTVFDAMCFLFFGKTCRGLKAGDIGSWVSSKKCEVSGTFLIQDRLYEVKRTWSPNSLMMREVGDDWEDTSQESVESLISLTFESFLHSILVSQTEQMFLDLGSTEKTAIFSTVLGLDVWLTRSKNAKVETDNLASQANDLDRDIEATQRVIVELSTRNYDTDILKWEEDRKERLRLVKNQKMSEDSALAKAEKSLVSIEKEMEETLSVQEEAESEAMVTQQAVDFANSKVNSKNSEITGLNSEKKTVERQRDKYLDTFSSGDCPTCGRPMTEEHLAAETDQFHDAIQSINLKTDKATKQLKSLQEAAYEAQEAHRETLGVLREVRDILNAKNGDKIRYATEIKAIKRSLDTLFRNTKQLMEEINPVKAEKEKNEARISQLMESKKKDELDLKVVRQKLDLTSYWIKGFKEVRMFLIEEALKQLEVEVNNALQGLGLMRWEINFSMDEELKSGDIKKGFSVYVSSPYNKKKVRWESWSGGEAQRLRLAGTMGLANLILNKRGLPTNLEIYDEPTAHLTPQGVEDLMEVLGKRAIDQNRQIWVVDHRSLANPGFSEIWTVVKDEYGSRVEKELK